MSARLPLATRALPADVVAIAGAADVGDEALHVVDEVLSWVPGLGAGAARAFALLVLALEEARAAGSTRLPLSELAAALARLGVAPAAAAADARAAATLAGDPPAALEPLFGVAGDHRPFILDDGCLYAHRDWLLEERLARALATREATPIADAPDAPALDAAVVAATPPGRTFTDEQRAALRAALTRPLTVITGGPGTGKTALLAGLVTALRALGLAPDEIALAAPTGRAANRVAEALRALPDAAALEPRTLHRLLGYRGGRGVLGAGEFRHHENFPLPHRAVLVDEASMVDLALMERLARALRPDARLVLLGDADQLPSVDAGAVFRELGPLAVRLTQSHRQDPSAPAGASVLAAARAVLAGDAAALVGASRARPADLTWSGFEHLEPAVTPGADRRLVAAFADYWMRARVRSLPDYDGLAGRVYGLADQTATTLDGAGDDAGALATLVAHHLSLRVLAVTRGAGAPTGAEALNALLARRAAELQGGPPDAAGDPAPGTPVLMIRNDYERGLYNGDQGVVVRAARPHEAPRLVCVFPRGAGLVAFPFEGLRGDLRTAYATTVHKAQGAELDHVALVLPERDVPLLCRELVYTALTRARQSAVVVGRAALLALAVARPLARASGLGARLASGRAPV